MSRIGRTPVALPSGVTVTVSDGVASVKGPKGTLTFTLLPHISVKVDGSRVLVTREGDEKSVRAQHGLTRAIVANMVQGVHQGYQKELEIIGVGFKAALKGKALQLSLGFSHSIDYTIPAGIEITQDEKNKNILRISGIDKQLVGQVAAQIRELRPPEPYKGKGIRYSDEVVRRKVGKAATAKAA